jgi:hypothetical protein
MQQKMSESRKIKEVKIRQKKKDLLA